MRQAVRVVRRGGYIVLGVLLLAYAAWDGPMVRLLRWLHMSLVQVKPELLVRVVFVGLLVGLVVFLRYRFRVHWRAAHPTNLEPGKPVPEAPEGIADRNREILLSMKAISARYSAAGIAIFGDMLTEPDAHQVRISDEAEPLGECLRITVSTTYGLLPYQLAALANEGAAVVLVPLIKATKGTMLDNIDTSDGADASVPFLSQRDARGLVALVLSGLFEQAFKPNNSALSQQQEDALWRLLRLACQPDRLSAGEVKRHFEAALEGAGQPTEEERVKQLRRICMFFAHNYLIVAETSVPSGRSFVLRYSKTIPLYGRADSTRLSWRVRLGLRPYKYILPINLAFTAQSYHFRMNGGPNWYVRNHHLIDVATEARVTQGELQSPAEPVYVRVRQGRALPYAHLYTRGTSPERKRLNLATVVEFGEVPPGALGVTFVLAASVAALMMFLALFVPSYDKEIVSGDVLALLLSVPPIAATFVGYSIHHVQRSSLSTVLGLLLVGVTSFVAAAMYVRPMPDSLLLHQPVFLGFLHRNSINILGLAIGLVAVCNAAHLYWRLQVETRHYLDLLKAKNSVATMSAEQKEGEE